MSFLYGAFLLGGLAIAAPIIFHLIKRTPKEHYEFSSLMFLKPSPPKMTKRSNLDQWLLLLLRSLAILLLAFAFMRPYLRAQADLSLDDAPQRHVAVLIDRSASMKRDDLWQQAVAKAKSVIDGLEPTDELSLYTFDETLETLVTPENTAELDRSERREVARTKLEELSPTWSGSHLGAALLGVAERLEAEDDLRQAHATLQIILIGDLQAGSQLDALQNSPWPETVRLDVQTISPSDPSNAKVRLVASAEENDEEDQVPRVRVRNAPGSSVEQFEVVWSDGQQDRSRPSTFYVPPGESLVLNVPFEMTGSAPDRLILRGDGAGKDFDNTYFVVPAMQEKIKIVYFGDDAEDDSEQMHFYLARAFGETPSRKVEVEAIKDDALPSWEFDASPRLVVVTKSITQAQQEALDKYMNAGGHVLVVLQSDEMTTSLSSWLGGVTAADSKEVSDKTSKPSYAMLGEIDFRDPLFVPFAGARYNDFTRIRFWKHRSVDLENVKDANVIARFEDRSPALWSTSRGKGSLYGMSSGWSRSDSQLALSTKFVPLLSRWLELASGGRLASESYVVNQSVPLPEADGKRSIRRPDGTQLELADDVTVFDQTTEPGIYTLIDNGAETKFAVNLDDSESETETLGIERLEQFDVATGTAPSQAEQLERMRQLRETELESRQKIWKWLIVAVLVLLGVETYLAAQRTRHPVGAIGDFA